MQSGSQGTRTGVSGTGPLGDIRGEGGGGTALAALGNAPQVVLSQRHVFGVNNFVNRGVHYVEESLVAYVAGHNVVLYSTETRGQKFLPGSVDSNGITCLALSSSGKYMAVAEECQFAATATIWDVVSGEKKKTITSNAPDTPKFIWMDFSAENKQLLTLGCGPEWNLSLWSWEKAKLLASIKIPVPTGCQLYSCSLNPSDANVAVIVGDGILKGYRIQEGSFKAIAGFGVSLPASHAMQARGNADQADIYLARLESSSSSKQLRYIRMAWLNDDSLLVVTREGQLVLFDSGGEFRATLPGSPTDQTPTCLAEFARGFLVGTMEGILIYEKSDDEKELYKLTTKVPAKIGTAGGGGGMSRTMQATMNRLNATSLEDHSDFYSTNDVLKSSTGVLSISISPSEEHFVALTTDGQLMQIPLGATDVIRTEEPSGSLLVAPFHTGPITGLSLCIRKPLAVTCGSDKTIRLWNIQERTCEHIKQFNDEPLCVSFHPGGFLVAVGFSDRIRVFAVQMTELKHIREIPFKACKDIQFSPGGQYFAAACGTLVHVFHTYNAAMVTPTLKGHTGRITSIAWSADDRALISAGLDGGLMEHDILNNGSRISETVAKGCKFNSVVVYRDLSSSKNVAIVASSDHQLKEYSQSKLLSSIATKGVSIGQLCLAKNARALFGGVTEPGRPGDIRVHRFPASTEFISRTAHLGPVNRIVVTADDRFLVSAGEDGCLYLFDIRERDRAGTEPAGRGSILARRDREGFSFSYSDEVLVTKQYLEEQASQISELKRQVEEYANAREFDFRHIDNHHREALVQLEDSFGQELEQERTKLELLNEERTDLEASMFERMQQLETEHAELKSAKEAEFQQKMTDEVANCAKLQVERDSARKSFEKRLKDIRAHYEELAADLRVAIDTMEKDYTSEIQNLEQQFKFKEDTYTETFKQIQEDTKREIKELQAEYADKIAAERNERNRHFCNAGTHKKGYEDLLRDLDKNTERLKQKNEELHLLDKEHEELTKNKLALAKTIEDHNNAIGHKEQRMFELKRQNRDLEKFKFVLDHKIKELKGQIDPRNEQLAQMRRYILEVDRLLEGFHGKKMELDRHIEELNHKKGAYTEELNHLRNKVVYNRSKIQDMRNAVHDCAQQLLDPVKLRASLLEMEARHLVNVEADTRRLSSEVLEETENHQKFLVKAVAALRKKLNDAQRTYKADNQNIIANNVKLIREISDLRKNLQLLRNAQHQTRLSELIDGANERLQKSQKARQRAVMEQQQLHTPRRL